MDVNVTGQPLTPSRGRVEANWSQEFILTGGIGQVTVGNLFTHSYLDIPECTGVGCSDFEATFGVPFTVSVRMIADRRAGNGYRAIYGRISFDQAVFTQGGQDLRGVQVAAVPEPSTLGTGLAALALSAARRRQRGTIAVWTPAA